MFYVKVDRQVNQPYKACVCGEMITGFYRNLQVNKRIIQV